MRSIHRRSSQASVNRPGSPSAFIALLVFTFFSNAFPTASWAGALTESPDLAYFDGPEFDDEKHRLDLVAPSDGSAAATMLWIHGGAWAFGDRKDDLELARAFAREGVAVAVMSYRLSPGSWRGEEFPATGVQHPEHVKDVARAFAWLHANADSYGLDDDRLFVSGFSAGGHLSALLAMDPRYLETFGLDPADMLAALPVAGGYDLNDYYTAIEEGMGEDTAIGHVLGVFGPRESLADASPITYLENATVPMLVLTEGQTADYTRVFEEAVAASGKTDLISFRYFNEETHASLLAMLSAEESPARDEMIAFMRSQLQD